MPGLLNKFGGEAIAAWRDVTVRTGWAAQDTGGMTFADAEVARLHEMRAAKAAVTAIDDDTWHGMLMPAYLESLVKGAGICGQQQLYAWLRGGQDDAGRAALARRLGEFERAEGGEAAAQLANVCLPLRTMQTEVTGLLFDDEPPAPPRWAGKCWLLMVGLLVSLALVALSPLAWLAVLFILVQMMVVQLHYMGAAEQGARLLDSVQLLLRGCSLAAAAAHPALGEFAPLAAQAGRLNRALSPSPVRQLPGVAVYLDWFLQSNIEHHFKSMGRIADNRDFLRQCFQLCARLEAEVALVRHRAAVSTCPAQRGPGIRLADAVHPLLAAPSPLSVDLQQRGVFVSGQNGIGKSTLLRTVGLNLLAARAFGFCYAATAEVPMLPVAASMQNEDSLGGGTSLYVAELQRARVLLELARAGAQCVFIVDEIFRGTNYLESVAAAAAVLDELAAANHVLVSSHNVVLASLLGHRLAPVCVARRPDGALVLGSGVLADVNGVSLLGRHGFGGALEARARAVADWLGASMAEPPGGAALLAPARGEHVKAA